MAVTMIKHNMPSVSGSYMQDEMDIFNFPLWVTDVFLSSFVWPDLSVKLQWMDGLYKMGQVKI